MPISSLQSVCSTTPPSPVPSPVAGGRAVLARKADRHIAAAMAEIVELVNGAALQTCIGARALALIPTPELGLCLVLQTGRLCPLTAVPPEQFLAQAAPLRALSLRTPMLLTVAAAALTWAASAVLSPWAWGLALCATGLHGAGVAFFAWLKTRVKTIDTQATRVHELAAAIQDWTQRKADALDMDGPNLQTIYEQRRERHPLVGLKSPNHA